MSVKIGHARIDENGRAKNGKAGDQTKKEVMVSNWYNGNWHTVFRPKDSKQAEKIAKCCEMGCANDHIGYDQNGRTSLYEAAKPYGFDVSKVKTDVETDCSAFVAVCCNYAGIPVTKNNWTGDQKSILTKTGAFEILTASKYTASSDYLKRGDILLKEGHTAMVLSDGAKIKTTTPVSTPKKETETFKSFTAYVTNVFTHLHVREKPTTNSKVLKELKNKTAVNVIGESGNWYKVTVDKVTGYVSKDYITKTKPKSKPAFKSYKAKVTASRLNVRKGAGMTNGIIRVIDKGTSVTIYAEKNGWGKISSTKDEWVKLDYVKKA